MQKRSQLDKKQSNYMSGTILGTACGRSMSSDHTKQTFADLVCRPIFISRVPGIFGEGCRDPPNKLTSQTSGRLS